METLIAMLVICMLTLVACDYAAFIVRHGRVNDRQMDAALLASNIMQDVLAGDPNDISDIGPTSCAGLAGPDYSDYTWTLLTDKEGRLCHLKVSVTYPKFSGRAEVSLYSARYLE